MADPVSLTGHRVQHVEGRNLYDELTQPGDYLGPIHSYTGEVPAVFFLLPVDLLPKEKPEGWSEEEYETARSIKNLAHVCSPPHTFSECADGSLEIRASILVTQRWKGQEFQWHGYLDCGHQWRTV